MPTDRASAPSCPNSTHPGASQPPGRGRSPPGVGECALPNPLGQRWGFSFAGVPPHRTRPLRWVRFPTVAPTLIARTVTPGLQPHTRARPDPAMPLTRSCRASADIAEYVDTVKIHRPRINPFGPLSGCLDRQWATVPNRKRCGRDAERLPPATDGRCPPSFRIQPPIPPSQLVTRDRWRLDDVGHVQCDAPGIK